MNIVTRHIVLALAVTTIGAVFLAVPPIAQDPAYHLFADQRSWFGIPNCLDVLSNLPFAVVGLLGLAITFRSGRGGTSFFNPWERWPYAALFAGTALTALGSGYYHLAPDNARLVWDRLPMTLGFMGLLTAVVTERLSRTTGRWLFAPLLAIGAGSVVYWYATELLGTGDLRPYLVVQFGSLAIVLLMLVLYPSRYSASGYFFAGLGAYIAAKLFELADRPIFAWGHLVSGHTLKHVMAAAGIAFVVAMLLVRVGRHAERSSPLTAA